MTLKRAVLDDAEALSELAVATFIEAYAGSLSEPGLTRFARETYGPAKLRGELGEEGSWFYLAPDGFIRMRLGTAPACVKGPSPIELSRIYVRRSAQGRGLGARLFAQALSCARERGCRTIWLPVWEKNEKALGFYRKLGFTPSGAQEFRYLDDRHNDLVLERPVDNLPCYNKA